VLESDIVVNEVVAVETTMQIMVIEVIGVAEASTIGLRRVAGSD